MSLLIGEYSRRLLNPCSSLLAQVIMTKMTQIDTTFTSRRNRGQRRGGFWVLLALKSACSTHRHIFFPASRQTGIGAHACLANEVTWNFSVHRNPPAYLMMGLRSSVITVLIFLSVLK